MPLVNVMVNGRAYTVACDDGEEEHLRKLAQHVDRKVGELLGSIGQVGDARLLLMAAILITDDYFAALDKLRSQEKALADAASAEGIAAEALEAAAKRVEDIAMGLERG
ncbi:MAG TPA: cell division protein ZapA [Rhizomicrobium sp.]|jgi:cell division protein ZapA